MAAFRTTERTETTGSRIAYAELDAWLCKAFQQAGMRAPEATVTAQVLADADLRGVFSHGSVRFPDYAQLVRQGRWKAGAEPELLFRSGALVLLEGGHGVGPYLAMKAMEEALRIAEVQGAAWVWVRNGGHFGPAAAFSTRAAREGFIGLAFTNSSPAMAAWGGRRAVLGANPWSIAIPRSSTAWPLVLDIANTVVARGRVKAAAARGEALEAGWAIDEEGRTTTDPVAALMGSLLPVGGHKGYAIAFMIEALVGAVSGSAMSLAVGAPVAGAGGHQGLGQVFAAIKLSALLSLDDMEARIEQLIQSVRSSGDAATTQEILVPGEREARVAEEQMRLGIDLPTEVRAAIVRGAELVGLTPPAACTVG